MREFLRRLAIAAILPAVAVLPATAVAQSWPTKPVTLIVPLAPGGAVDQTGRFFAERLGRALGQSVVVENVPGAVGAIGLQKLARSAPDGYTLAVTANSFQTISPHLAVTPLPYDTIKSFTPISGLVEFPHVVIVNAESPVKTLQELVARAKSDPGGLRHGSSGATGATHMSSMVFRQRAGIEFTDVFYKGNGPVMLDLIGGHVDLAFDVLGGAISQINGGKVRALATTGARRHELTPEVPTVAETYPDFRTSGWFALYGPAGMPADVVERLNAEVARIHASADFKDFVAKFGYEPMTGSASEIAARQGREFAMWEQVAKSQPKPGAAK